MTVPAGWFAQRLSSLSDEEVLALARGGNRGAVEHLLKRYRGLVEGKARSYFMLGADHDDVIQEGMIGLFKAIRDFKSDRLVCFRAFAEVCVTRQIITAVKSASRRKHVPLNEYVPLHRPTGEDGLLLVDVVRDSRADEPEAALVNGRLSDYLERYGTTELSELECRVIRCRLQGKTYQQMAAELRCRPKSVDNALQRAKRKIWNRLTEMSD